jgi:hypothetical protein
MLYNTGVAERFKAVDLSCCKTISTGAIRASSNLVAGNIIFEFLGNILLPTCFCLRVCLCFCPSFAVEESKSKSVDVHFSGQDPSNPA